jgi:DHA2 family multidrug resistance protein
MSIDSASPAPAIPQFPAISPAQAGLILAGLSMATGMEFYTFDSVNLVLPDITGALGVSPDEGSWLLTVYSSFLFLGVPVSIWMACHFGYKRYLLGTITLFAVSSLGCAVSPTFGGLLVCRAVQGFAGAGLVVWWRASIYVLFPKPQRSGSLARVSTVLFLSSAAGLVLSAYIVEHWNWRLIFIPNLVLAAGAAILLASSFPSVPTPMTARTAGIDGVGITLLAIGLICLQIALSRGQLDDWLESEHIRTLLGTSAAALGAFVLWQLCPWNARPLLSLELLRNRHVLASALMGVCTGMILSGSLFALPEFLRNVAAIRHSAGQTGRIICIYALTAAALRPLMVRVIAWLGQRKVIVISLLALIGSMLLFVRFLTFATPDSRFVWPLILFGCCLTTLLPSVGSGTVARIGQAELLDGVSLYMTFRQLGGALGVAFLTVLLERRETLHSSRLVEHLQLDAPATHAWLEGTAHTLATHGGYSGPAIQGASLKLLAEATARQVSTLSYADAFLAMAGVGIFALCLVPIMLPPPPAMQPVSRP